MQNKRRSVTLRKQIGLLRFEQPENQNVGYVEGVIMKKKKHTEFSTFLGTEAKIEGAIEFEGTIRLDGNVKGKILSESGTVIIGEKAIIDAEITVGSAIIMGNVTGEINAKDRIEVYPPGVVVGDIYAPVIAIDTGAVFNGSCGMKGKTIIQKNESSGQNHLDVAENSERT